MGTKIEWTEETWNPIVGCSKCSPGCENCYAERMANRLAGSALKKKPAVDVTRGIGRYVSVVGPDGKWNGSTAIDDSKNMDGEGELYKPLRMKKPRRIFVVSMGDLFHENNSDQDIGDIYLIQECAPQHTYIWLTKRINRALEWHKKVKKEENIKGNNWKWPDNIWLGVTVCDQEEANLKIPVLIDIPAAVLFVSIEPMLGAIDLPLSGLDWVIAGSESGPVRRNVPFEYFCSLKNQCVNANVPFFFKQFSIANILQKMPVLNGKVWNQYPKVKV